MGFSRTNLFKRLESSGYSFILSVQRHILRNYVYLHAIENNEPLPIGTQDVEMLDADTLTKTPMTLMSPAASLKKTTIATP